MSTAYQKLQTAFTQISALEGAASMLGWDAETMMPEGAADIRGEQLAALATVIHEKMTNPAIAQWLDRAKDESGLSLWQQANLREMQREYLHANALPADLVHALTKARIACEHVWREARKENDFARFKPYFETVLSLVQQAATVKGEALKLSPYDALLDSYDPGMRCQVIDGYFAELESFLPDLVSRAIDAQSKKPAAPITDTIPIDRQTALGREFMTLLGFDFSAGRIDTSAHPFCGGVPGDVRLTTRYKESAFTESLYGVLHETGHALYEMGLPRDWITQPVGRARGMSMHESQSLLVEMQLCRGRDFLAFALPKIRAAFGVSGAAWDEENVSRNLTRVSRSLIRVNADEVTYPLHVILRYQLEKQLLSGALRVADLPEVWDERMEALVGIKPDCVGNGCMQDVHWPGGNIGYFPTYTIGAMIAAQLFHAANQALPDLPSLIRHGDFHPLFSWLRENVHGKGSSLSTMELVEQATGQPLNVAIYRAHLERRYVSG